MKNKFLYQKQSGELLYNFLMSDVSKESLRADELLVLQRRKNMFTKNERNITHEFIACLNTYRTHASNTLRRSQSAMMQWVNAQLLLNDWLLKEKIPALGDLLHLNAMLTGKNKIFFRTQDIFTFGVKHPSPAELSTLMSRFFLWLNEALVKDPIYAAFMCRYFIVSVHPFSDANGRTSQLMADYFLLRNNYLPQIFFSRLEKLVVGNHETRSYMNPKRAFQRFIQTIVNAYDLSELYRCVKAD
ncbi:MAG: Fic family protein [Myxococcales bacterium]|nr:Fic family protein [Myxococcales bacterium]USN50546.1 MAG: Fic family protein [Myxococcales bacterium]